MLSITTKSPYAVRALTELGRSAQSGPVPIAELARRREIPVQFLEQLFSVLRRAGVRICRSVRMARHGAGIAGMNQALHKAERVRKRQRDG